MNKLLLLLLLLGAGTTAFSGNALGLKPFLKKVSKAIESGNADEMMSYIQPDYKAEQWDSFMDKNTKQFLTELLCGKNTVTQQYACCDFYEIEKITFEIKKDKYEDGIHFIPMRIKYKGSYFDGEIMVIESDQLFITGAVG